MKGKKKINNNRSPCAVEKTYLRRSVLWDKRMRRSNQLAILKTIWLYAQMSLDNIRQFK
jgi:hypothetical protein